MNPKNNSITLEILGKSMTLGCSAGDVEHLKAAANAFNRTAKEITSKQNIVDSERLAILAGLTLANELNRYHQEAAEFLELSDELKTILA